MCTGHVGVSLPGLLLSATSSFLSTRFHRNATPARATLPRQAGITIKNRHSAQVPGLVRMPAGAARER